MGLTLVRSFAAPTVDITIPQPGNKKDIEIHLPQLGYIPRAVAEEVDAWTTARFLEVQKLRDERNKKRIPMPTSDRDVAYPTNLDVMDQMLTRVDPDAAAVIADLTERERDDIWRYWNEKSAPADLEKSAASSDSSDATE